VAHRWSEAETRCGTSKEKPQRSSGKGLASEISWFSRRTRPLGPGLVLGRAHIPKNTQPHFWRQRMSARQSPGTYRFFAFSGDHRNRRINGQMIWLDLYSGDTGICLSPAICRFRRPPEKANGRNRHHQNQNFQRALPGSHTYLVWTRSTPFRTAAKFQCSVSPSRTPRTRRGKSVSDRKNKRKNWDLWWSVAERLARESGFTYIACLTSYHIERKTLPTPLYMFV
jgi:hypothetical protein